MCIRPCNSGWLSNMYFCCKTHNIPPTQHMRIMQNNKTTMLCIVLVGFLPDNNGCNCNLHPFGCGNALILNCDDWGVGIHLCLCMIVEHELLSYTITVTVQIFVVFVSPQGSTQLEIKVCAWMVLSRRSQPSSHWIMRTGL